MPGIPLKLFRRIVIERVVARMDCQIADEQGGFRKGRGSVD